ncbi:MAG: hypothetical protein B7Z78_04480 [Rhodospirillales bacterium 20-60-12]|nr:MAG: hypothetical protein B7Z78_04480 [Rhodospirillales bacterium 20-60-12]
MAGYDADFVGALEQGLQMSLQMQFKMDVIFAVMNHQIRCCFNREGTEYIGDGWDAANTENAIFIIHAVTVRQPDDRRVFKDPDELTGKFDERGIIIEVIGAEPHTQYLAPVRFV